MKFIAYINVMPLKALLDPQGKAVTARLHTMGLKAVADARIGKHMELAVEAKDRKTAEAAVERACKELLHNPIMESYEYEVKEAAETAAKKAPATKKTAPAKKADPAKKTAAKTTAKPAAKATAAKKAAPKTAKKTTKK